jgi:trehalose-6-phosphate synthase
VQVDNALDIEETARAMERALEMPEKERRRALEGARSIVESTKPEDWIYSQIDDLEAIAEGNAPKTPI